ncbi:MAG: RHS repeat-associated core domain-containing protein, partial [Patescibacteria group bacterium]
TYDSVGNITQTVDNSLTDTAKTMVYGYDDLHRLTSAIATNATSTSPGNFTQIYAYDAIGDITNKSDIGNYLYQGTNYANPHAATSVGGVTYTYDNNGNLTSDSTWTHSWNYANQLTQSQKTGSTVTYQYDHTGQRTKYYDGASGYARHYPNKLYNIKQTTATKHIYAGSQLVATVEGSTLQYLHTDHLTGSNVATNSTGGMVQLLDYYPYGSMRIDWKYGSFDEQRKFTGHEFDRDTNLTYANARYYKQSIGRFLSQDTLFLDLGDELKVLVAYDRIHSKILRDPQQLNSYSYARNNPLKYVDKGGEAVDTVVDVGFIVYDLFKVGQAIFKGGDVKGELTSLALDVGGALVPGVTGLGVIARTTRVADKAADAAKAVNRASNLVPSANNYREVFQRAFGQLSSNMQIHHTLPQKYEALFKEAGINIHELPYLRAVPIEHHKKISSEWLKWDKANEGNVTVETVQDFAKQIEQKYGDNYLKPDVD